MAVDIKLPDLGENIAEGGVLEIRVKPGDIVSANDIVVVIEAEKSTVEVPAGVSGKITDVSVKQGDKVKPGALLMRAEATGASKSAESPKIAEPKPAATTAPFASKMASASSPSIGKGGAPPGGSTTERNGERTDYRTQPTHANAEMIPAGPATRRLARKFGIDLAQIRGTGPRGRITQDDVIALAQRGERAGVAMPPLPDFAKWGPVEAKPFDFVRKKTAEQMSVAWSQIPHVTHHDLADVTDLEAFRRSQDGKGPKLTVTAFALKACAVALKELPNFNASISGEQLILKHYCHIGVAVDTDRGLLVPVIRDVDKKPIRELAAELTEIAEKARARKLSIDDMKGGSFTISNLGGIGGVGFTPLVNWPEVAILGLSRSRTEPVLHNDQWIARLMLPLSLSYDHRVIDGADGARFTRRVAALLENPMLLLVEA